MFVYVPNPQTVAAQELDELCFLSAQSMSSLKTSEHFQVVKLLGEGSYGKVMLAVHKKRGWCKSKGHDYLDWFNISSLSAYR